MDDDDFAPTHVVPQSGLTARSAPSFDAPQAGSLDPWLPVRVTERDGPWARIECQNTWSAWVEAEPLIRRIAAPARVQRRTTLLLWAGMALGLIATVLPWLRLSVGAWRVPVGVLWESGGLYGGGMTLGLLIAIVVVGIGGASVATASPFAARLAGGILLGIAGIFLARAFFSAGGQALRLVGPGPFALILAGVALLVAHGSSRPDAVPDRPGLGG